LGIAESGFVPGVAYYLSLWFTPNERAFRFALFLSSVNVAGAIAGIAAYGLLQLDGSGTLHGWQWLFLLEGLPSIVFGLLSIIILPASPATAKWLSPEEKEYAISRISNSLKDTDHSRISKTQLKNVLTDIRVWFAAFLYCTQCTVIYSISFFLPAIIHQFGFSDIISNLLTVPVHAACIIAIILNGLHSDRTSERFLHSIIPSAFGIIFWGLEAYSLEQDNLAFQYIILILASLSTSMAGPISVIWPMDFLVGSTTAAIAPAMIIGIGNLGGIIGPQIFGLSYMRTKTYTWGPLALAVCSFLSIVFATGLWIVLKREKLNEEEQYLLEEKK